MNVCPLCRCSYTNWTTTALGCDDFYTDPNAIQLYKNHVKTMLTRVNTVTGIAYGNDPTIMGAPLKVFVVLFMSLSCLPQGVPAQRFLYHPSGPLPFLTWHLIAVSKLSFDIRTDLNLNKRLRESYLEGSQEGFIKRQ